MPFQQAPEPWQYIPVGVTQLLSVGYAPDTDYLLAIGSVGRGVFNCSFNAPKSRVAYDTDMTEENTWQNIINLTAKGISPIHKHIISIAGLYGGGLPLHTNDGWSLEKVAPNWPLSCVLLGPPNRNLIGLQPYAEYDECIKLKPIGEDDIIAYGFSQTGKSFIVAVSHTIHIFSRP
jgi:hypothetical protein